MREPEWRLSRRNWLQGAAAFAASTLMTDCGYTANYVYAPPTGLVLPPLPGPVVMGTLTVTAAASGVIPERFMGLSYEKFTLSYGYFHASNHNLIRLFRGLGAGVLRIGGGAVDRVQFLAQGNGTHQQVTPAQIKALAGFLEASGWSCIYGVNLATSTPALAAAEVTSVVSALGSSLLGIEIGNEPDEYGVKSQFFPPDWSFSDFLDRWIVFRSAIVEATPGVPMTGPATAAGNDIATWTLPFGQAVTAAEISLLTQHYYRASGAAASATAAFLISRDDRLSSQLIELNQGAQQLGIPFRLSECNSFYGGGAPGVSNSYASALWVIDFLFAAANGGASGVNLHGGGNAPGIHTHCRRFRFPDRSAAGVLRLDVLCHGRNRYLTRDPVGRGRPGRDQLCGPSRRGRFARDGGKQGPIAKPNPDH